MYGKIFLLRVGIGISITTCLYLRWKRKRIQKAQLLHKHHQEDMDNMRRKLAMTKGETQGDQQLVIQFVAYLEKFTTKQQTQRPFFSFLHFMFLQPS